VGNHFSAQFVFYARSCSSSFFCSNKYHFLFSRGNNISLTVADVSTMASSSSPPVKALLNVQHEEYRMMESRKMGNSLAI
jgi:hypothetical protein